MQCIQAVLCLIFSIPNFPIHCYNLLKSIKGFLQSLRKRRHPKLNSVNGTPKTQKPFGWNFGRHYSSIMISNKKQFLNYKNISRLTTKIKIEPQIKLQAFKYPRKKALKKEKKRKGSMIRSIQPGRLRFDFGVLWREIYRLLQIRNAAVLSLPLRARGLVSGFTAKAAKLVGLTRHPTQFFWFRSNLFLGSKKSEQILKLNVFYFLN